MNLREAKSAYEELSAKASDVIRQLSLAGIALIWIFRTNADQTPTLHQDLLRGALFITVALACDLLQYLIGTLIWFRYFRYREKRGTPEEEDFAAPTMLNWPGWFLFTVKSVMMILAYGLYLIPFLATKFFV